MILEYSLILNDILVGDKKIRFETNKTMTVLTSESSTYSNEEKNIIKIDDDYNILDINNINSYGICISKFNNSKIHSNEKFYNEDFFIINLPRIFQENKQFYLIMNSTNYKLSYIRVIRKRKNTFVILNPEYLYLSYDDTGFLKYCENLVTGMIMKINN